MTNSGALATTGKSHSLRWCSEGQSGDWTMGIMKAVGPLDPPCLIGDAGCNPFIPMTSGRRFKSTIRIPRKKKIFCAYQTLILFKLFTRSNIRIPPQAPPKRVSAQRLAPGSIFMDHQCLVLPGLVVMLCTPALLQHPNSAMFVSLGPLLQRSQLWLSLLRGHKYAFQSHTWFHQVNICSAIRASCLKGTL